MSLNLEPGFERDFDVARRAVERGWLAPGHVEAAMLAVDMLPGSRLLSHLPLTPDQIAELEGGSVRQLPEEVEKAAADPARRVGRYVLVESIGRGGMGHVHRAWDMELCRWVALKFLRRVGNDHAEVRFEREAKLAAGLSHPGIAAIYETGQAGAERYIAMQLVTGRTLSQWPRTDLTGAVRLVRDAARAVDYAHRQGIIHRDLKPDNLMVETTGEGSRVVVLDFGLARPIEGDGKHSIPGDVIGTPSYMSPEQARGGKIDRRADVFSLGATLYEALTSKRAFGGATVMEALRNVENLEPVAPRRLNPRIPADLETIVLKCLEKDRDRRYASARELADDLDRFLKHLPIQAHPPGLLYRLQMMLKRKAVALTAVVSAAILVGLLGWYLIIVAPDAKYATRYADATTLWAEVLRSAGVGGDPAGIHERARRAREAFERAIEAREEAKAQLMRGRCLQLEGREDEAARAVERARELDPANAEVRVALIKIFFLKYIASRGSPSTAMRLLSGQGAGPTLYVDTLPQETEEQRGWHMRGEKLLAEGVADSTQEGLLKGLRAMGKADFPRAAMDFASYWKNERWDVETLRLEAYCRYVANDLRGAVGALDQLVSRIQDARGFNLRGLVKSAQGLYDEAIADHTKAIDLNPKLAIAYTNRGNAKHAKGLWDEAIADHTMAIDLDPKLARACANRGNAKRAKGLWEEAIADYSKAIERNPKFAGAYCSRGAARRDLKDYIGAMSDFDKAIELDPKCASAYCGRGAIRCDDFRDYDGAIRELDRAIGLDSKEPIAYLNRGVARAGLKDYKGAIQDINKSIELDPRLAFAYHNRGITLKDLKDYEGAIRDFDTVIKLDPTCKGIYANRSEVRMQLGDIKGAIEDSEKAIEVDPKYAGGYCCRGALRCDVLRDYEGAIRDFDKAIKLDPSFADAYQGRGNALWGLKDYEGAIRECNKAIQLDPKHANAYVSRATARLELGDFKGTLEDCDKAIELDPKLATAYRNRGWARAVLNDHSAAVRDYDRAIELDPKNAWTYCGRGGIRCDVLRDYEGAIRDFDRAIELDANFALAYGNRGLARRKLGDYERAFRDFDKSIELDPKHANAFNNRGNAKSDKGRLDEAIADYTRAIELDPKFALAYTNRGGTKQAKGLIDEAIADFNEAIRLDPNNFTAYCHRGNAKYAKGSVEEAIADYKKAIELAPADEPLRPTMEKSLARMEASLSADPKLKAAQERFEVSNKHHNAGKYAEAIEGFRKIAEEFPKTEIGISAAYNVACGYALLGKNKEALDWLEKSVEMGWKDAAHLERDPDLNSLRGEKRYRELVEKLKQK